MYISFTRWRQQCSSEVSKLPLLKWLKSTQSFRLRLNYHSTSPFFPKRQVWCRVNHVLKSKFLPHSSEFIDITPLWSQLYLQFWPVLCPLSHFWGFWVIDFLPFGIYIRVKLLSLNYRDWACKSRPKTVSRSRRQCNKKQSYFQCLDYMNLSISFFI